MQVWQCVVHVLAAIGTLFTLREAGKSVTIWDPPLTLTHFYHCMAGPVLCRPPRKVFPVSIWSGPKMPSMDSEDSSNHDNSTLEVPVYEPPKSEPEFKSDLRGKTYERVIRSLWTLLEQLGVFSWRIAATYLDIKRAQWLQRLFLLSKTSLLSLSSYAGAESIIVLSILGLTLLNWLSWRLYKFFSVRFGNILRRRAEDSSRRRVIKKLVSEFIATQIGTKNTKIPMLKAKSQYLERQYTKSLDLLETRCFEAETRHSEAEKRCAEAKTRCTEAETRCSAAERSCSAAEKHCSEAEKRSTEAEKRSTEAEKRSTEAEKRSTEAERERDEIRVKSSSQRQTNNSLIAYATKMRESSEHANEQVKQFQRRIETADENLKQITNELAGEKEDKKRLLDKRIPEVEKQLKQEKADCAELRRQMGELKQWKDECLAGINEKFQPRQEHIETPQDWEDEGDFPMLGNHRITTASGGVPMMAHRPIQIKRLRNTHHVFRTGRIRFRGVSKCIRSQTTEHSGRDDDDLDYDSLFDEGPEGDKGPEGLDEDKAAERLDEDQGSSTSPPQPLKWVDDTGEGFEPVHSNFPGLGLSAPLWDAANHSKEEEATDDNDDNDYDSLFDEGPEGLKEDKGPEEDQGSSMSPLQPLSWADDAEEEFGPIHSNLPGLGLSAPSRDAANHSKEEEATTVWNAHSVGLSPSTPLGDAASGLTTSADSTLDDKQISPEIDVSITNTTRAFPEDVEKDSCAPIMDDADDIQGSDGHDTTSRHPDGSGQDLPAPQIDAGSDPQGSDVPWKPSLRDQSTERPLPNLSQPTDALAAPDSASKKKHRRGVRGGRRKQEKKEARARYEETRGENGGDPATKGHGDMEDAAIRIDGKNKDEVSPSAQNEESESTPETVTEQTTMGSDSLNRSQAAPVQPQQIMPARSREEIANSTKDDQHALRPEEEPKTQTAEALNVDDSVSDKEDSPSSSPESGSTSDTVTGQPLTSPDSLESPQAAVNPSRRILTARIPRVKSKVSKDDQHATKAAGPRQAGFVFSSAIPGLNAVNWPRFGESTSTPMTSTNQLVTPGSASSSQREGTRPVDLTFGTVVTEFASTPQLLTNAVPATPLGTPLLTRSTPPSIALQEARKPVSDWQFGSNPWTTPSEVSKAVQFGKDRDGESYAVSQTDTDLPTNKPSSEENKKLSPKELESVKKQIERMAKDRDNASPIAKPKTPGWQKNKSARKTAK